MCDAGVKRPPARCLRRAGLRPLPLPHATKHPTTIPGGGEKARSASARRRCPRCRLRHSRGRRPQLRRGPRPWRAAGRALPDPSGSASSRGRAGDCPRSGQAAETQGISPCLSPGAHRRPCSGRPPHSTLPKTGSRAGMARLTGDPRRPAACRREPVERGRWSHFFRNWGNPWIVGRQQVVPAKAAAADTVDRGLRLPVPARRRPRWIELVLAESRPRPQPARVRAGGFRCRAAGCRPATVRRQRDRAAQWATIAVRPSAPSG